MQTHEQRKYDVIVIGGGAAGLMAAGTAAKNGKRVLLLEKNKYLGEKLKITGGGRCNILNAEADTRALLGQFGSSEQFLYSAFARFGMQEAFAFFEGLSLPLVVQGRKRAFPESERAEDVVRVMRKYVDEAGVITKVGVPVANIEFTNGRIISITAGKHTYEADSYILATGGLSHPETGSTGDGFHWLEQFGHTIKKPTPSIVPVMVEDAWVKELSGTTLKDVKITFYQNGTKKFGRSGDILCTHFGLSGPLILNAAKSIQDLLYAGPVETAIDLFPSMDAATLERSLLELFERNKNKMLKNVLAELAPVGTLSALLHHADTVVIVETKVNSVTKEMRRELAARFKKLPLTITGLMGFGKAVVADGGVPLTEVDTRTMKSKLVENLFIVGDLLDINRPSGGYSLQLCWTTGYIAGASA